MKLSKVLEQIVLEKTGFEYDSGEVVEELIATLVTHCEENAIYCRDEDEQAHNSWKALKEAFEENEEIDLD